MHADRTTAARQVIASLSHRVARAVHCLATAKERSAADRRWARIVWRGSHVMTFPRKRALMPLHEHSAT